MTHMDMRDGIFTSQLQGRSLAHKIQHDGVRQLHAIRVRDQRRLESGEGEAARAESSAGPGVGGGGGEGEFDLAVLVD